MQKNEIFKNNYFSLKSNKTKISNAHRRAKMSISKDQDSKSIGRKILTVLDFCPEIRIFKASLLRKNKNCLKNYFSLKSNKTKISNAHCRANMSISKD